MKKILLIEDRVARQKDLCINLDNYRVSLHNAIDEKYDKVFHELKNDTFDINNYSLIMTHKNAFNHDSKILNSLKKQCKDKNIPLVYFSGEITVNYLNESRDFMEISSTDFYSDNIKLFLKEENSNLLMLMYGKKWKLNILLNAFEYVNLYISQNIGDINFKLFNNDKRMKELYNIDLNFYTPICQGRQTNISEIIKLKENILEHIKEMADE